MIDFRLTVEASKGTTFPIKQQHKLYDSITSAVSVVLTAAIGQELGTTYQRLF